MTSDPRDQQSGPEFEQDLKAVRSAWSGLEQTDPPELLNQAVLNTARRELNTRRRSRPLRWLGGFATATVIVQSSVQVSNTAVRKVKLFHQVRSQL